MESKPFYMRSGLWAVVIGISLAVVQALIEDVSIPAQEIQQQTFSTIDKIIALLMTYSASAGVSKIGNFKK